jgi:GntR family transcriptional regulator/MocR family aminotransferase
MPKKASAFELVLPPAPDGRPVYEWLYQVLRERILSGRLRPGTRLPSSRELAMQYGLARGTIVNAFELLKSEGYLQGNVGAGTFVSEVLPDDLLPAPSTTEGTKSTRLSRRFTPYARRVQLYPNFQSYSLTPFRANVPALDLFPAKLWASIASRSMRDATTSMLMGTGATGYAPLREALADYLNTWRGVHCRADQIIIVSGVQEALDLCARLFVEPGDRVCVEDPGYAGASVVFEAAGAKIVPVRVDDEGIQVHAKRLTGARMIYVTPGHQAPLGVTMSLPRRLALLEHAQRFGSLIFEDDYDSEFRYSSRPVPALQGLDSSGCVIFAGTLNKVLFPSLRLGYIVAPPDLLPKFEAIKSQTSRHAQMLDQVVLTEFIKEGYFARHLRRMREVYAERLGTLLDAAQTHLGGMLNVSGIEAGLQTIGWLPAGIDSVAASRAAFARGIITTPLREYARTRLDRDGLQLGFASTTPAQIRRGVRELAAALEDLRT